MTISNGKTHYFSGDLPQFPEGSLFKIKAGWKTPELKGGFIIGKSLISMVRPWSIFQPWLMKPESSLVAKMVI